MLIFYHEKNDDFNKTNQKLIKVESNKIKIGSHFPNGHHYPHILSQR